MIFLLSLKMWDKFKKKLVEPKDYIILDATDNEDSKMTQFTNVVSMDNFCLPMKLIRVIQEEDYDGIIDVDKIEELEDNFFRSGNFETSVLATMSIFLERDINVFIVMKNAAFKYYRKKFKAEFCKIIPDADPLIFIIDKKDFDKNKKALRASITRDEAEILKKQVRKKEKEMEGAHKEKRKKTKKKKKNNDGWGFSF